MRHAYDACMGVWLLLFTAAALGDEPGFGGAPVEDVPAARVEDDVAVSSGLPEFVGGASTPTSFPEAPPPLPTPKKTRLEEELERARLDPARFPLIQLRVDVARLDAQRAELENQGRSAAQEVRTELEATKAILVDVERIALHRMNVCATRNAKGTSVKNYRMTAAGPVRLSTSEMLAQTATVDPDGCARIELVDRAVVDRVKRAHELRKILATTTFPFHKLDDKRALEREQKALLAELAKEDVPVISLAGGRDGKLRR
jgi:hypothetical protein